jgi:hypothetical protein
MSVGRVGLEPRPRDCESGAVGQANYVSATSADTCRRLTSPSEFGECAVAYGTELKSHQPWRILKTWHSLSASKDSASGLCKDARARRRDCGRRRGTRAETQGGPASPGALDTRRCNAARGCVFDSGGHRVRTWRSRVVEQAEARASTEHLVNRPREVPQRIPPTACMCLLPLNWWAGLDSNQRPRDYESPALTG